MTNCLVRFACVASLAFPGAAVAQSDSGVPIPRATSFHFTSRILGETRIIDFSEYLTRSPPLPVGIEYLTP